MALNLGEAVLQIDTGGTAKLAAGLSAAKNVVMSFGSAFTSVMGPIAAMIGGALALKEAIMAAAEGEVAVASLAAALRANGQEVDKNVEAAKEFANEIMATTRTGDEAVLGLLTYGTNLGLTAQQSQEMAKASIGLATALGIDASGAMKMLTMESRGNASALEKQIPALKGVEDQAKRLQIIQETARSGMQQEQEITATAAGGWEQFKNSLGELSETIGSLVLPAMVAAMNGIKSIVDWVTTGIAIVSEFGFQAGDSFSGVGNVLSGLGSIAATVFESIKSFLGEVLFAILNWDLTVQTLGLTFAETFTNIWNHISAFGTNVASIASWMFENWKQIFTDIFNMTTTIFSNMATNIYEFFAQVASWLAGDGFNFEWTGLTKGFESAIKEMPKIIEAETADFSDQWADLDKDWEERTKKWADITADNMGTKTMEQMQADMKNIELPTIGNAAADDKGKKKKTGAGKAADEAGSFKSIVSVWKDAQSALLKDQDKTPEDILAAAEEQVVEQKKGNELLEKMVAKNCVAVLA